MNKILITIALAACSLVTNAQSIFKKEANWMDTKNGISYEMNIFSKSAKYDNKNLAKANFTIVGDVSLLQKIELLQDGNLKFNLPLKSETCEIQLKPGNYTFRMFHKKLGEKDFEVELKKAQLNKIKLTIK
ncbi:hypothetical protein ACFOWA_08370 [Pedobacter lithocola]|uniref:Uncharacterized protein n=1 Tax=Pedobacter lithocola TaxID=1908239 RepID=A0ABV8PAI2_9SPHI